MGGCVWVCVGVCVLKLKIWPGQDQAPTYQVTMSDQYNT